MRQESYLTVRQVVLGYMKQGTILDVILWSPIRLNTATYPAMQTHWREVLNSIFFFSLTHLTTYEALKPSLSCYLPITRSIRREGFMFFFLRSRARNETKIAVTRILTRIGHIHFNDNNRSIPHASIWTCNK